MLEAIERIVVVLAAGFAAFPLYQWYSEAPDRRLERVAGLVQAAAACDAFLYADDLKGSLARNKPSAHLELCVEVYSGILADPLRGISFDDPEEVRRHLHKLYDSLRE